MKKKELYEAPSVETYDLVPEGNLLNAGIDSTGRSYNESNHTEYLGTETDGGLL